MENSKLIYERKSEFFPKKNFFKRIYTYKNIFLLFTNIIAFIFLIIAKHLYIKSLKGCKGDEFICVINNNLTYILDDIYYCTLSALYFLGFLFFFHFQLCSSLQIIIFLLIIFQLIYKDRGDSFLHHGMMNIISLLILIFFGEIIILILKLILINIKKKKYANSFLILLILAYIYLAIYINNKDKYYCKDWDKSLNNTYINNNKSIYSCSVNIPKEKCLIDIFSPLLDISSLLNINCSNRKNEEQTYLKKISNLKNDKNIQKIGFPITIGDNEEIKGEPSMYGGILLKYVKNNLINLDNKTQLNDLHPNKKPEVYVDFTNNPFGELKININYNQLLSEERKSLEKNNNSSNILFLFLDNLSRVHFYRHYKKTKMFLKTFLSYEGFSTKENPEQKYHAFEFLKYHKFKYATLNNAIPMFSGVYYDNNSTMKSIVKDMKKIGYITCNVQDVCHKELMGIGKIPSYSYIEFDHEYAAPNCDPNVYKEGYGFFGGENNILRKCLYGKDSIEHSLEYGKKFWVTYKDNKKFLRIVNTYAHEYSGEKSKYADEATFNFLYHLYNQNLLQNTIVFIAGDHGFELMGLYKLFEPNDWKIEKHFPIFLLITPDKKKVSYMDQYSEILKNQQVFITPFDIYYTIRQIMYGEEYKNNLLKEQNNEGESLFKYINPKERNCTKYKKIDECQCK